MSENVNEEVLQWSGDLYKETRLGGRPFVHLVIPLSEVPIHDYGSGLGLPFNPDFTKVISFISSRVRSEEGLKSAVEKPTTFAFRGLTRTMGSEEYKDTRAIEKIGVDVGGPNKDKTWFTEGDLEHTLLCSIPRQNQKVGLIIISRADGMTWGDDFQTEGVRLKDGHSFKSLHLGTLQIVVDPPVNP